MTTAEGLLLKILTDTDYVEFHHWTEIRINEEGSDECRRLCMDGTVDLTDDESAYIEKVWFEA